jgi:2-dehydropantoate 2-reductase
MKITIIGAGAMGSVYAGLLADAGNEVHVVDIWQEHIDAINRDGLRVAGASGDRVVTDIHAHNSTNGIGVCDLVIIATKASGVSAAANSAAPITDEHSIILTIQNGLGAGERIEAAISNDNILLGVAGGFGASMRAPGYAHHNGMELIRVGEMQGGISQRVTMITNVWQDAGFNVKAYEDINQLIWEKFICNVTFSAPCTVFEKTIGELMQDPYAWPVAKQCAKEAYDTAIAKQINLSFDDPDVYITRFGQNMPEARPSMYLDHLDRRKSEIDAINGMVPVVAKEVGLSAPYNEVISALVRSRELGF